MSSRASLLLLAVSVVAGCNPTTPQTRPTPPSVSDPTIEFALGPGDVFDVRVFGEPELSGTYRVGPDGTIDFHFIGQIEVAGKLPHAIAQSLQQRLREGYLRNPQVTVTVREQNSKKITIMGEVAKPGTFSYTPNMGIVEGISMAGGFTPMARKNSTTVTRVENGQPRTLEVAAGDISEGKASNFVLRPGDIISVPQRIF